LEANKSKYSCVSASCGKPLFSEVKFCPYCAEPYVSEESKLKALQEAKAKEEQELVKQQALAKENAKAQAAAKALADQEAKQAAEALAKAEAKAKKDQEKAQAEANKQAEAKAKQEAQEAQKAEQEKDKAKQQEQVTQTKSDTANKSGSEATTTTKAPRTYQVKPEDKKGGFGKWFLILAVLGVVGFYGAKQWSVLGGGANMCEQTITDVTGMLATGDANGALIKIKEVLPDCSGDSKTRLVDIQKAANKALKAQTATCNAALSKVNQAINKNQIISARKAFDKLPANCESFNQAKNLKDTLTQKEDLIKTAESDFDAAIADGNLDKAKIALNKLQEVTREHVNLAKMKTQLDEAMRKSEASAPASAPLPVPAPVQNTAPNNNRQNQVAPAPANNQNQPQVTNSVRDWVDANRRAGNNQAQAPAPVKLPNNAADIEQAANNRMVQTFMQEAQNALQQKRFDVARTQVQNALRVDPGNKEAQLLMRRINEVQMQTLRIQTTID
jgi:hypothetical protein